MQGSGKERFGFRSAGGHASRWRIRGLVRKSGATSVLAALVLALGGFSGVPAPRGTPLELALAGGKIPVLLSRNQQTLLVQYRDGRRWRAETVTSLPGTAHWVASALAVHDGKAVVAVETVGGRNRARLTVFWPRKGSVGWTEAFATTIPSGVGGALNLALAGRYAWLMATGTPSAGMMSKMLWMSPNYGRTWTLVATNAVPSVAAPYALPEGYPTGMVVAGQGTLIVTLSPRGKPTDLAEYHGNRQPPRFWTFRPASRYVSEALPALVGPKMIAVPIIESSAGTNVLAEATTTPAMKHWAIRPLGKETSIPAAVVTGGDLDVLVEAHSLQFVSAQGFVGQTASPSWIGHPPIAAVAAGNHLVVWGPGRTLRESAGGRGWHPFTVP